MAKHKLERFAENLTFTNLFQHTQFDVRQNGFPMQGKWRSDYFHNDYPIVLELGCGKGEYTVGLAQRFPQKNFIGVDRKGARLWRGCKDAFEQKMPNVAFLRAPIDDIAYYFGPEEVDEIWITFPDPQPVKPRKRLMSPKFIEKYTHFLKPEGVLNLKTDSRLLYDYVREIAPEEHWTIQEDIYDIYATGETSILTEIQTFYEKQWLAAGRIISYLRWKIHP